jgi:hypothetical protein
LQAALIGAVIGGISGGLAKGLGDLNPGGDFFSWGHAEQTLGHALLGGAVSEVQGGSFGSGALAGAVNGAFGPAISRIGGGRPDFEYVAERVAVSAVLGGTVSELGGGKFANGAVTAAFLRLYNEESFHAKYTDGHSYWYRDSRGTGGYFQTVGAQAVPTSAETDGTAGWDTAEEAAQVAIDSSWSFSGGNEWAGVVFQNPDGSYGYTIAFSTSSWFFYPGINSPTQSWTGPTDINGSSASAIWHIHAGGTKYNSVFSGGDLKEAMLINVPNYMGDMRGGIYMLNPTGHGTPGMFDHFNPDKIIRRPAPGG